MSGKCTSRSDKEWLQLITDCRNSGLSDRAWCELYNIPSSTFYNAVSRLRKKACSIPEHQHTIPVMDLTSRKQDVVQIDIVPDMVPQATTGTNNKEVSSPYLDNLHTIEILFQNGPSISINNAADPALLEKVISSVVRSLC